MVSSTHEVLHEFFRDKPEEIEHIFRALGHEQFPEIAKVTPICNDLTTVVPHERRADTVLEMVAKGGEKFTLVVESQGKKDDDKRLSWPYYVAYLYDKCKAPVVLVVVTQCKETAKWAADPITISTDFWDSFELRPIVLGPEQVPLPEEPITDADLPIAVLGVLTHSKDRQIDSKLDGVAKALMRADEATASFYSTQIALVLPETILKKWGKLMSMDFDTLARNPLLGRIIAEHDAEEKAKTVIRLLDRRGIALSPDQRERVRECADLEALDRWLDVVIEVQDAGELFEA